MSETEIYNWLGLEALPLFSASIEIMESETKQQHVYTLHLERDQYIIDNNFVIRIICYYQTQLNKTMFYYAQLRRWNDNLNDDNEANKNTITGLLEKVENIQKLSQSIIKIANVLQFKKFKCGRPCIC